MPQVESISTERVDDDDGTFFRFKYHAYDGKGRELAPVVGEWARTLTKASSYLLHKLADERPASLFFLVSEAIDARNRKAVHDLMEGRW